MADKWDQIFVDAQRAETAPVQRRSDAQMRSADASAARTEAELPTVAAQAGATLENTRQSMTIAQQKAVDDLRGQYEKNPAYVKYNLVAPALATALHTDENPAGDIALTYAAAKIFDPDSAVRDQEQQALGNTTNFLDSAVQQIKKQYNADDSGTFSPQARERLRAEIIRKTNALNIDYNRVRVQYQGLARDRGYEPRQVIGEHIGAGFMPQLQSYQDAMNAAHNPTPSATDAASGEVGGEPIKAPRLSGGAEAEITQWARTSPDFTVEEWARRITDKNIDEGLAPPEARDALYRSALDAGQSYFGGMSAEDRAKIPAGYDYSEADRVAQEDAGVGETLLQAGRNLPESFVQLAEGITKIPVDVLSSIADRTRTGAVKTIPDLAGELIMAAGGEPSGETMQAVGTMLEERYGGFDELKNTLVTDPVGLAGDISMLFSGGGTAAARLPGAAGRVGEAVATAGRVLDPISGVRSAVEAIPRVVPAGVGRAVVEGGSELAAMPSGIGGRTVREAASAGFERGRTGAPTPGSAAFTENMRNPGEHVDAIVETARNAVGELRTAASTQYRQQMAQFGQNPVPLDINVVRQRMARIRPSNYDAMLDAPNRPSSHVAWDQMNQTVEHYAAQAAQDPSLLEPLQMDAFKQDLYDIGSRIGGAFDRDAARIARTAYNGVREELVRHDPLYAETMADYERAAREAQQLDQTFGIAAARGKQVNIDSATRKLQSIMRNNANTNYGQREALGDRLAELDPTGTFLPSIAGQAASSWRPRGLQSAVGTSVGTGLGLSGAASVPALVAAAPTFSPRAMGEMSYGAGRAAGTAARVLEPTGRRLLGLQERYPASTLAMAQLGSRLEGVDQANAPEPPGPDMPVMGGTEEIQIDPVTGDYILPDGRHVRAKDLERLKGVESFADGGPVYGALHHLRRRYKDGGEVEKWGGEDYRAALRSSVEQAPGGAKELATEILPGMVGSAYRYLRDSSPSRVGDDLMDLGQRYVNHWRNEPREAILDHAESLIPVAGDLIAFNRDQERAAALRHAGDVRSARLVERYSIPANSLGLIPAIGDVPAFVARRAVRNSVSRTARTAARRAAVR